MTIPSTDIKFSKLQSVFGGSNPIFLSEYYRDYPDKFAYALTSSPLMGGNPKNPISISMFKNTSKPTVPVTTTESKGSITYVSETIGTTKSIDIFTNPYWTQTVKISVRWTSYEVIRTDVYYEWVNYGYGFVVQVPYYTDIYGNVNYEVLLSTTIIYANNYKAFEITQNTNVNPNQTELQNLGFDGQPNTNRHTYWRRTGEFFVNITYSQPP